MIYAQKRMCHYFLATQLPVFFLLIFTLLTWFSSRPPSASLPSQSHPASIPCQHWERSYQLWYHDVSPAERANMSRLARLDTSDIEPRAPLAFRGFLASVPKTSKKRITGKCYRFKIVVELEWFFFYQFSARKSIQPVPNVANRQQVLSAEKQSGFHLTVENNSRLLWFAFLRLVIGLKNSRHFLKQLQIEPKSIVTCSRIFSRATRQLHVLSSSFDWFAGLPVPFVIGQRSSYFGFGFTTLNLSAGKHVTCCKRGKACNNYC